jgi:hypothetical protein
MKRILVIAVFFTILASTSKAGLGWTLEECICHYGSIDHSDTDEPFTDLPKHHFKVKDFEITTVMNNEGKVVTITYFSHLMSEQDISNLLAGNAPKAEWKIRSKEHTRSTGDEMFWDGFEDGSRKYWAWSWTILYARANPQIYGTKVLEIATSEYGALKKDYEERRAKSLRNM